MIQSLKNCVELFRSNLKAANSLKITVLIFKSIAFIEKNSLNRMHFVSDFDSFYEQIDIYFTENIEQVDSLRLCGEVLIGFGKALFYPDNFMPVLKRKMVDLLLNAKKEQKGNQFFTKMNELVLVKNKLVKAIASFSRNEDLNSQQIAERNKLVNELSTLEKETSSKFGLFSAHTNSIFEMNKLFSALSKFAPQIHKTDPSFLKDLFEIALTAVEEIYQNRQIISLFGKNLDQGTFIYLMRSVKKVVLHFI